MGKIFPTKSQWKKWGLLSRASYVSCLVGVFALLLTAVLALFSNSADKQISAPFTENTLSGSDINASAVLQGVEADNISVSVITSQVHNSIEKTPIPHFEVYVNGLAAPIGDHTVIALGEDRTVRIRVQNIGEVAADNISMSVYVPLKPNDLVSAGWTRQAPPINSKTRQEVTGLLHLWSVAAGLVPEQGWFRAPLLSISKDSPRPMFTRRALEELGFEFSGSAAHCPEDFVFHVLPLIVSINSTRSTNYKFYLFFSY